MSAYYNGKKVDITYTSDMNVDTFRNKCANAITDTKSGINVLRIDDTSPLANKMKVTIEAVNLINQEEFFAANNFKIKGEIGKTYIFSCVPREGAETLGSIADVGESLLTIPLSNETNSVVITIEEGHTYTWDFDGYNASDIYESVSMVLADVSDVNVKSYGKNLCDVSKVSARNASESVTQIDNTTFEWNGSYYFEIAITLPAGTTFTYSWGELIYDYSMSYPLRLNSASMVYADGTVSAVMSNTYTLTAEKDVQKIRIYKSVSDKFKVVVKNLQIEVENAQTEFEVFKLPVDNIVSISPTTTLIADTSGVEITAEYSKDTIKVIQELKNAILNLGGTI